MKKIVLVCDIDGTLTDGKMYYTKEGKAMKAFGCDDWDALMALSKKIELCFISGDTKGFPITSKRIEDEMGYTLNTVPSNAKLRWKWIEKNFKGYTIIFIGDGIYDYLSLENADHSFTVKDALTHVKDSAKIVLDRNGGERFVAQCCLIINNTLDLKCFEGIYD